MALEIKDNDTYVHLHFTGQITASDFTEMASLLGRIEASADTTPHRVVDMAGAEDILLNFEAVAAFARARRTAVLKNPVNSALVVSSPVQFGFMRMFQTLDDHPSITSRIFWNLDMAEEWIGGDTVCANS